MQGNSFYFLGVYTYDVVDGKCGFPKKWESARSMGLKWLKLRDADSEWYMLIMTDQKDEVLSEFQDLNITELGKCEFAEDRKLCLPEELEGPIELLGCADRIEILPQTENKRRQAEMEQLMPEFIDQMLQW